MRAGSSEGRTLGLGKDFSHSVGQNPERRFLYKRATALFPHAPCSVSPSQCPNWERVSGFCVYAGTPRLLIVRGRLATLTAQTLL